MTVAVYMLSSSDRIEAFASTYPKPRYDDVHRVWVGQSVDDVRSVVFVDESPSVLRSTIANGEEDVQQQALKDFKKQIREMLYVQSVYYDNLHVFVHFGGQDEDELSRFNNSLKLLTGETGTFRCYAISFGNHSPDELFPDRVFSPPYGEVFHKMCRKLGNERIDDLEHLRALRLLLPVASYDEETKKFILNDVCTPLFLAFNKKWFGHVLTDYERAWLARREEIQTLFGMNEKNDSVKMPKVLSCEEYGFLIENLLKKGTEK